MMNQFGSSRMDTVLKMLLIAFVSMLAFSSGVYFGKQLSDSDYELKRLEADFNKGQAGDVADAGTDLEDRIAEEETNALADKLVSSSKGEIEGEVRKLASDPHAAPQANAKDHADESHGAEHGKATADPHAAKTKSNPAKQPGKDDGHANKSAQHSAHQSVSHAVPAPKSAAPVNAPAAAPAAKSNDHHAPGAQSPQGSHKPDLSAATKAALRVANNAAPAEPAKAPVEARVPTSLPKTVGTSQDVEFTVQIASYPTKEAAEDHARDLEKKGFPAFAVEAAVSGKVWYRVSVGTFRSQKAATDYRAQLLKQTSLPSAIVQKIVR